MKKNLALFLLFLFYVQLLPAQQNTFIQNKSTPRSNGITNSALKIWVERTNQTVVGLYEKFEIIVGLDGASYNNPYDPDQIDIRAVFTSPSGKKWNIFGFYDNYLNANQWKIRFAPNETGSWSYYLTVTDAGGSGQSETYQFNAIASTHHGWLHVSDDNPRYLEHDDGTSFYGVGMCYPWNVYKTGLSRLASFGANLFFYWNGTYDGAGNGGGKNLIESVNSGLGRYDQHKSARLDELIQWSEELNLGMVLVIWPHDYFCDQFAGWPVGWFSNPYKSLCAAKDIYGHQQAFEYQQKQYRYIIARWGYSRALAAWQIICEITGTDGWEFGDHAVAEQWCQKVHDYFQMNDPFRHPTTGSQHGYVTCDWPKGYAIFDLPNREIYEAQGFSYDPNNRLRSSYQNYVRITRQIWNDFQKPIICGETGYSLTFVEAGTPEYVQLYHNALWATLATGMAGTPFWWAYGGGNIVTEEMLQQMKVLAGYVKTIAVAHTIFSPAAISAEKCDAYALKSDSLAFGWIRQIDNLNVSGCTFKLSGMADGAYFIHWFDTWSGQVLQTDLQICCNRTITATIPNLSPAHPDIAFTLVATEPGGQPAALGLFADKAAVFNDKHDTAQVTCVIKDDQGRLCVAATNEIQFHIQGSGRLLEGNVHRASNGIVLVHFVPDSVVGMSKIIATSSGLLPDTVAIEVKNNFSVEDFEGYASNSHLKSYWLAYAGTQTSISLDSQVKNSGAFGLKFDYSIGTPVFAGIYRKVDMDWRRFSALKWWIKPDGSQRTLALMIKDHNGNIWQHEYILSGTEPTTVIVRFTDLKLYFGSGELDLSAINQLIFYLTRGSGANGSGTIYLDDIEVLTDAPTAINSFDTPKAPPNFRLFQNYPNPFNRQTVIRYQLSASCQVEIAIFDLLGKKILTLINEQQTAGHYQTEVDTARLTSGIYFYQIKAGDFVQARKMMVLR
jgi:hypothetical protein